ncbi:MAG: hypothetical protein V3R73_04360, partial [Sphingomonadales bacterium]
EALICRFLAILDPFSPIRYRSLVLSMDGMPGAIARYFALDDKDSLADLKLLIGTGLFRSILDLAMEKNPAAVEVRQNLADYRETVNSQRLSLGMENVLYDMNPSLPCLSAKFGDKWVSNAGDAIRELDRVVGETGSSNNVFDRHLSAFCVHKEDDLRPLFLVLPNADIPKGRQALQLLRVFGKVQRQQALGPLKHLAEHLTKALKSLVGDLHNHNRRERIDGQLLANVGSGDMNRIYREMNLENEQNSDEEEFQTARSGYAFLEGERRRFKATIEAGGPQAQKVGQAAALILGLVVLGFSLVNMLGRL